MTAGESAEMAMLTREVVRLERELERLQGILEALGVDASKEEDGHADRSSMPGVRVEYFPQGE